MDDVAERSITCCVTATPSCCHCSITLARTASYSAPFVVVIIISSFWPSLLRTLLPSASFQPASSSIAAAFARSGLSADGVLMPPSWLGINGPSRRCTPSPSEVRIAAVLVPSWRALRTARSFRMGLVLFISKYTPRSVGTVVVVYWLRGISLRITTERSVAPLNSPACKAETISCCVL